MGFIDGLCEDCNERFDSLNEGYFLTSWATVSFASMTLLHGLSYVKLHLPSVQVFAFFITITAFKLVSSRKWYYANFGEHKTI